jgi:hypothetical protein
MGRLVESEVKGLLSAALLVALATIEANRGLHEGLSAALVDAERLERGQLTPWLAPALVPDALRAFVLEGTLPDASALPPSLQAGVARLVPEFLSRLPGAASASSPAAP